MRGWISLMHAWLVVMANPCGRLDALPGGHYYYRIIIIIIIIIITNEYYE